MKNFVYMLWFWSMLRAISCLIKYNEWNNRKRLTTASNLRVQELSWDSCEIHKPTCDTCFSKRLIISSNEPPVQSTSSAMLLTGVSRRSLLQSISENEGNNSAGMDEHTSCEKRHHTNCYALLFFVVSKKIYIQCLKANVTMPDNFDQTRVPSTESKILKCV